MANRSTSSHWFHPVSIARAFIARPKLLVAIGIGLVLYFILPQGLPGSVRTTLAWDTGALVYLVAACWIMTGEGPAEIRQRAAEHDESALAIPVIVAAAIAASFLAVAGVLSEAKSAAGGDAKPLLLLLAGSTIVLSWFVMQTVFTIHYAHEFYAPRRSSEKPEGCLQFAGEEEPDYWDFLYFASTVGATSQTSDTEVSSSAMRRLVTAHSIISFFFNTIVLALTINIAAGLI